jgi:DNA-binding SARP family transcriptional activator/class 3 adenylate cyclase
VGARFAILGPVEVETRSGPVVIRGAKRRALLVRLLISANQRVPIDRLADDVWEGAPGAGSPSTLTSHISLLRSLIGADRIVSQAGTYSLTVNAGELDVSEFEAATLAGQEALRRSEFGQAAETLSGGLSQWRGRALTDVSGASWAQGEATRLEELRLGAEDSLLDARMALGLHRDVIAVAETAVNEQPLREHRWATLMLALYRSGRRADALRTFQRLNALLGDELGLEPSSALINLESAILKRSPDLELVALATPTVTSGESPSSPSPETATGHTLSITAALLVTDWSNLGTVSSDPRFDEPDVLRRALFTLLRSVIVEHGGKEIKSPDKGLMALFLSSSAALAAAAAMQRRVSQEDRRTGRIARLSIGISAGAVTSKGGDIFGYPTVEASRLCALAGSGQILAANLVRKMAGDRCRLHFADQGELDLAGLPRPVPTQLVEWEEGGWEAESE